jgi:GntR family transcriptional regulator
MPDLDREFTPDSSFYAYLRDRLGVTLGDVDERIETVLATPREALLIGTPPALPMLLIHRVSRDAGGNPLERVRTLYRGDRFSFTTHLGR